MKPTKRKKEPTDTEMLDWLGKRVRKVDRWMGVWWVLPYAGTPPKELQGRTIRAAIRAAMKAERGK